MLLKILTINEKKLLEAVENLVSGSFFFLSLSPVSIFPFLFLGKWGREREKNVVWKSEFGSSENKVVGDS